MNIKPTLYLIIGVPGSGKSTYAKELADKLYPRAQYVKDGGSARYCSFCKGLIYEIDSYHSFYDEGDNVYFQVGCIIYIFGHEVFNNVHVDYSHLAVERNDAKVSEINEQLESIFSTSK